MLDKILITGGTGFIGTILCRELVKLDYSPTVVSRNSRSQVVISKQLKNVTYVELNLLDYQKVTRFILTFKPTVIINLAGVSKKTEHNVNVIEELNFTAAVNLFEAAQQVKVRRFIQIGTADEYGSQPTPQNESYDLKPDSEYSHSKAKATIYGLSMLDNASFPIVILRPFTVYGAFQPMEMFLSQLIFCALRNQEFCMTDGFQKRDYVFVDDVVAAIIAASTKNNIIGEVFNIGSGQTFALKEIAKKVWNIIGADKKLLKIGAKKAETFELHDTFADITKAKKLLKWHPRISFDEGLRQTIEAIKENFKEKR
jgi:UDP-glucose 4-epimerase